MQYGHALTLLLIIVLSRKPWEYNLGSLQAIRTLAKRSSHDARSGTFANSPGGIREGKRPGNDIMPGLSDKPRGVYYSNLEVARVSRR